MTNLELNHSLQHEINISLVYLVSHKTHFKIPNKKFKKCGKTISSSANHIIFFKMESHVDIPGNLQMLS